MKKLDVSDLVGGTYKAGGNDREIGIDCLAASRLVAQRIYPDLAPEELPLDEAAFAAREAMDRGAHRWKLVGKSRASATRLGDIVVSKCGPEVGVSILVDEAGGQVLSAYPGEGIVVRSILSVHGVEGVYRRSRAP